MKVYFVLRMNYTGNLRRLFINIIEMNKINADNKNKLFSTSLDWFKMKQIDCESR